MAGRWRNIDKRRGRERLVLVAVHVRVLNLVGRNGHHQAAVLHALEADQQIRKLGNLG